MTCGAITRAPFLALVSLVVSMVVLSSGSAAAATSAARLLDQANDQYLAGDLDAARDSYKEVLDLAPEAAAIHYGLGNLAHRAEHWDKAAGHYLDALSRLRGEEGLERKILYNLGNNAFRKGMVEAENEPATALETLETAAGYYMDVLDRTRRIRSDSEREKAAAELDAGYNLEVVRVRMKEILDRMEKEKEEEQDDNTRQLAKMIVEWLDLQREVLGRIDAARQAANVVIPADRAADDSVPADPPTEEADADASETDEDPATVAARTAAIDALFRAFEQSLTTVSEKSAEVRQEIDDQLEALAQAAQAPGGGAPGVPGSPPGGAAGGGGPQPVQQRPGQLQPEQLEAAKLFGDSFDMIHEETLAAFARRDVVEGVEQAERGLDSTAKMLTAVHAMRGLERHVLVAVEAQEKVRALTERLSTGAPSEGWAAYKFVEAESARERGSVRAAGLTGQTNATLAQLEQQREAQKQAEAQQQGAPGSGAAPVPGGMPGQPDPADSMQEIFDLLGAVRDELAFGAGHVKEGAAHLSAERYAEAVAADDQAIPHLSEAHRLLNDFLKEWSDWLKEAVVQQTEIVAETTAAVSMKQQGADPSDAVAATLEGQIENLETTRKCLEKLIPQAEAEKMNADATQASVAQQTGAPPNPDAPTLLQEIQQLVEEGMAAEEQARSLFEAADPEGAYEPAELARQKLEEALKKAQQSQGQDQQNQDQNDESDEQDENQDQQDQDQDQNQDDNQEDQQDDQQNQDQNDDEQEQDPEDQQSAQMQAVLSPQEAMEKLLEMMQKQEMSRERLRERYGEPRKGGSPKVEKDW